MFEWLLNSVRATYHIRKHACALPLLRGTSAARAFGFQRQPLQRIGAQERAKRANAHLTAW